MTIHRFELIHESPAMSGDVEWDDEAGTVTGPLAGIIQRIAAQAAADRSIDTAPHPASFAVSAEPLQSRRDMALILSTHWPVPEELRGDLPSTPADEESDAPLLR